MQRWKLVLTMVAVPALAHADLLRVALDGDAGGGTGSGAAAPPSEQANDLRSWAGDPKATSLPELIQFAMQHAPALASAKLDIAVAEAQIAETWARRDWRLGAQVQYSRAGASSFSGVPVEDSIQGYGEIDIGRMLPTGGTIGLKAESSYSKASILGGTQKNWTDNVSITLNQPLLKGYGPTLYNAQERRATLTRDAAVLGRRLSALNTIEAVVSAYWDLVLAEQQVAITEQSLALARERLRVTEIQVKGGKVADAEVPAVQQIIATREEDVLNGELAVLDRSIALRRAVGLPIGAGEMGLRVTTELGAKDTALNLADLVQRTFDAAPQLAQLDKNEQAATIDVEVNDNGLLPQLDLALQAGPNGQDRLFGGSWRDTAKFESYQVAGTLTFSQTLHKYDVKYRSRELRSVREKVRVNAADVRAQLAQGMAQAVAQIEVAKRRLVLSERAIELAKANIRIETDRFNLGRSTNFDVLNRLEEQRQAELRRAQALIDWHKAETVVQTLTGDLLPAFGVSVD